MRQRVLFEGQVGDKSIDLVLPELIAKAREMREDVFLRWNGATIRIAGCDTVESLMREYNEQLHCFALATKEELGELITMQQVEKKVVDFVRHIFQKEG